MKKKKKKTHVILTSMATNKRTALTGVMSGSQWELLAAMPIKAQFVMTAMTPSASNAAFKKKKKNQPTNQTKKYVRSAQDTFLPSCADSSILSIDRKRNLGLKSWPSRQS